jgi:hypothetical protein
MAAGLIVALGAAAVSVVASLFGLLSKKSQPEKKAVLEVDGKRYDLSKEQIEKLLSDIRSQSEAERPGRLMAH